MYLYIYRIYIIYILYIYTETYLYIYICTHTYTSFIIYILPYVCVHTYIYALKITYIYLTVSLITALLKYDSHTTKFTHLKCTVQWVLVDSQNYALSTTIKFRTFSLPQ